MRLDGGIDMYSSVLIDGDFNRYKSYKTPGGRKVVFLNKNGWDWDLEYANKYMTEGDILTIKEIYVGRSSSEVEFIQFPNKRFNTVMFDDVE